MPHIHTQDGQHDLTASAFIVYTGDEGSKILLHKHKIIDKWMQFGGHVELHENPWQAVAHEIAEESGYELKQLKLLQPSLRIDSKQASDATVHPQPFFVLTVRFEGMDHLHTDLGYAFITDQQPLHTTAEGETSELRAMTLQEIRELPNGSIPENVRSSAIFLITEILSEWEAVSPAEFVL